MPREAALVAEGVGYILDSDVSRIRNQRPEAHAGEGCDGAIGTHTTKKSRQIHWAQFPTLCCSSSQGDQRAVSPARWRTGRPFRSRSPAPRSPQPVSLSSPGQRQRRLPSWPVPALALLVLTSRPPSFLQPRPSKERSPSAPARSPPAKP